MKILTISNLYPPDAIGGYEILCLDVMRALAENGHDITILTSSYGGCHVHSSEQKVLRRLTLLADQHNIYQPFDPDPRERERINAANIAILKETITAINPELIFVWNLHFLDPSFLLCLEHLERRIVYFLTDNWLIAFHSPSFISDYFAREVYASASGPKNWLRRLRSRFFENKTETRVFSGAAIFPSSFMQNLYFQSGVRFARHVIIPHGIQQIASDRACLPRSGKLAAKHELCLLFAGRIVEVKGVHTIIEALPLIVQALPEIRVSLTIIGDARDQPYRDRIQKRIEELSLAAVVSFEAPVPELELPEVFNRHDIYLFPSLYEPFSLTLIHALRAGIPTVASMAGGTPEIIFHRRTGMVHVPGSHRDLARQVIILAESESLRVKLSRQCREHAVQFTFSGMVAEVERYLSSTCYEEI